MNSKCINLQTISDYLAGHLNEHSVSDIECHIADCSRCREQVVLSQAVFQDNELIPESTLTENQASQVIENLQLTPGFFETCKKGIQSITQTIQNKWYGYKDQLAVGMSPHLGFVPVHVRSGESWEKNIRYLRIPLHDHYIDCAIQKSGPGECHLYLKVMAEKGKAKNCRLILTDVTGKARSRMADSCEIQFENIPCGECYLKLYQNGLPAGATKLYTGHFMP